MQAREEFIRQKFQFALFEAWGKLNKEFAFGLATQLNVGNK